MEAFSGLYQEAQELYDIATTQIALLGFPGSVELWELRNYWSRIRMMLHDHVMQAKEIEKEYSK